MLAIVVNIEIEEGKEAEAVAAFQANAAGSRREPGCLKWEWSQRVDDPSRFAIYELYVDQGAIDFHRKSPHFLAWQAGLDRWVKAKSSGIFQVTGVDPRPVPSD